MLMAIVYRSLDEPNKYDMVTIVWIAWDAEVRVLTN
jgi:hypothetical protein